MKYTEIIVNEMITRNMLNRIVDTTDWKLKVESESMIWERVDPARGFGNLCLFYGQLKQWSKLLSETRK